MCIYLTEPHLKFSIGFSHNYKRGEKGYVVGQVTHLLPVQRDEDIEKIEASESQKSIFLLICQPAIQLKSSNDAFLTLLITLQLNCSLRKLLAKNELTILMYYQRGKSFFDQTDKLFL